jgi:hypothetical protein
MPTPHYPELVRIYAESERLEVNADHLSSFLDLDTNPGSCQGFCLPRKNAGTEFSIPLLQVARKSGAGLEVLSTGCAVEVIVICLVHVNPPFLALCRTSGICRFVRVSCARGAGS